jgi:hypothetical protein
MPQHDISIERLPRHFDRAFTTDQQDQTDVLTLIGAFGKFPKITKGMLCGLLSSSS